jgi:hypothetical protein
MNQGKDGEKIARGGRKEGKKLKWLGVRRGSITDFCPFKSSPPYTRPFFKRFFFEIVRPFFYITGPVMGVEEDDWMRGVAGRASWPARMARDRSFL